MPSPDSGRSRFNPRHFLFHQVYGIIITRRKYSKQHILALVDVSFEDIGDKGEAPYGIQINHKRKSFQVRDSAAELAAVAALLTFPLRPDLCAIAGRKGRVVRQTQGVH